MSTTNNQSFRTNSRRAATWMVVSVALIGSVLACQVPVFRYALERWNPDRYQVMVLSNGDLQPQQQALLSSLNSDSNRPPAVDLRVIDVSQTNDSVSRDLWAKHKRGSDPVMVALYPESSSSTPNHAAHAATLSQQNVKQLVNSPVRDEVVRRLTDGQSAVWILVESGNKEKDDAARRVLETQLTLDAHWLKLPTPAELEVDPAVITDVKIDLRIEFSVVAVRRDDPQEQFLLDCLLNSESDLRDYDEPIAFPVFGRGRVLYALVGKGIAAETIRTASSFVAGPCSCQVKNQNPGFDLLLSCDWDAAVGSTFISQPIPGGDAGPTLLTIPPGKTSR